MEHLCLLLVMNNLLGTLFSRPTLLHVVHKVISADGIVCQSGLVVVGYLLLDAFSFLQFFFVR
jgi:hypothetical protein